MDIYIYIPCIKILFFLHFNLLILQNKFFYYKLNLLLKNKNKKNIYKIILIYDI